MLHDTEIEIPEFIVRFNDNSPPCLTSPWSRSSFTVRSKQLEINSEGGIRENVVEVVSPPHSQYTIPAQMSETNDSRAEPKNSIQHQ